MTYKDLRYGNWIKGHLTGRYLQVDWLVMKHMEDGNIQSVYTPEIPVYEPVPIMPEILACAGFDNTVGSSTSNYKHWCTNGYFDVRFTEEGFTVYHNTGGVKTILEHIKYLHQIQNLYYLWTGAEIEFKQPITPQSAP